MKEVLGILFGVLLLVLSLLASCSQSSDTYCFHPSPFGAGLEVERKHGYIVVTASPPKGCMDDEPSPALQPASPSPSPEQ